MVGGKNLWAGLENYLLETATGQDKRLTVFTGPVFDDRDPVIRGEKIPVRYWTVAATIKKSGGFAATGYLISQKDLVDRDFPGVEEIAPAEVARMYQVSIKKIQKLTGLDFGKLADFDPTITLEAAGPEGPQFPIEDLSQIRV